MSGFLTVMGAGSSSIEDLLENSPGISWFQDFFRNWIKLDITTIAAVLAIFGMISAAVRDLQGVAVKLYWWITKFFTASVSIASNDRLNKEVLNWLGANVLTRQDTRILTASSEEIEKDAWHYRRETRERNDLNMEKRTPIQYLPTFGTTWFLHEGNIFIVRRISTNYTSSLIGGVPDEYAAAPEGDEPLVVMCLGRSVKPIKNFLETCRSFADQQSESYVTVRTCKSQYDRGSWDTTILRPLRPLETVHFDEQTKADIVTDITKYLEPATRRFYNMRGIPYRRGYLLHGPPGTGKTSLSLALAGHFGLDLHLLHIPSVQGDYELEALFAVLPPRCFILLEDIDCVGIKQRVDDLENNDDDDDDDDKSQIMYRPSCTLSGLLNVLDGVASQEGRIVLMTSNFAEKLDKALVRPGRIDRMIYLGYISQRSAELMFMRMFSPESDNSSNSDSLMELASGELEKLALKFSHQIQEDTFTPAQLQGYLLRHRGAPVAAAEEIATWAKEEIEQMEAAKEKAKEVAAAKKRRRAKNKLAALQGLAAAEARLNEMNNRVSSDEPKTNPTDASKDIHEDVEHGAESTESVKTDSSDEKDTSV